MIRWAETMRWDRRTLWLAAVAVALCALTAATQRRLRSGPAAGPAARAALIAARLIAWPPVGAPTTVPTPVTASVSRHGTR